MEKNYKLISVYRALLEALRDKPGNLRLLECLHTIGNLINLDIQTIACDIEFNTRQTL